MNQTENEMTLIEWEVKSEESQKGKLVLSNQIFFKRMWTRGHL
jgi:hypothetical protein